MNTLKKITKVPITVMTESVDDFFIRGKKIARLLDKNIPITPHHIISFEDTDDLIRFLTHNKLKLISVVRKKPNSVTGLSKLLHRSRAAIDKDIHDLESVGIIKSEYVSNPGHGRCRMISAVSKYPIKLQVQTTI